MRRSSRTIVAVKRRPAAPGRGSESESLLASIVESSDDAIIGKTLDGVITSWNEGARRMYGWSAEEAVGRPVAMLAPPGAKDEITRILRRIKLGKSVVHLETVRLKKNGERIDVSLTISPIRRGGRVVGASAIARDITDRKRSEERFKLVVEAAPSALVMVDADGRIVLANSQAEKLFGYTRRELSALTIEALMPARFRAAHLGHRAGFSRAPSTRSMGAGRDLFGLRKDGTEVPVEIGLNPLKEGEHYFVLASIIDITARRALERKLAHSETLASIGSMAAVLGHEIRNPLSSIVMAAGALGRGDLSPEDAASVQSILVDESKRLHRTLEDFLQYSRPREPKRELADLNQTASEVLRAATVDKELVGKTTVETALDPKLPPFLFDQDQIRQVLWNLIRNALQALGGSGRLELTTVALADKVLLKVKDDGPGIPRFELEKIFTPFFTTKSKGTGLGLPISRNIVLAHGGEIRADGEPGRGCLFTVELPLAGAA